MPTKPDAEEAAVNAELATAHAEKAADDAAKADRELAEATKEDPEAKLCPACNGELTKHSDASSHKKGAYHCNTCGVCWAPGLREPRS